MIVETIKHQDVRGKYLFYLKFKNNGKEVIINVGEKTYENITELQSINSLKTADAVKGGHK